ncbi:MAG TPA: hypothetical protein VEA80_17220 [Vitreimonas sp.]|uniref:hypothetical protein n=1 Tax=Vitreimonas sp. TaxID=3069702 RepID=UPI002D4CE61D|nr:hypothetical protein [Vitreimonas sp.]HYD89223.1 hypothetical protein [Vitreimonas sp.]
MIYLIGQLSIWLFLTALSAGVAGWIYAAQRGAPERLALRRERDRLVRDLGRLAAGDDSAAADLEAERARAEAADSLARIRESRIAELEHALENARARVDEVSGEAAELRRLAERREADAEELARLRELAAAHEAERAAAIEADAEPVEEEDGALLAWRLRYFEQRVRYLEAQPNHVAPAPIVQAPVAEPLAPSPLPEWRAREAAARAAYLEQELRARAAPAAAAAEPEAEPFASDVDVDVLLRWRLLYLERRVAHLQTQAAQAEPVSAPAREAGPDPDLWKWRARYLEARVRHLEERAAAAPAAEMIAAPVEAPEALAEPAPEPPPPAAPAPAPQRRVKPPVLASARNGAPDDLTLIDSISLMQQTTLYALGVYHYDQIAAWTAEHVAWIDQYLRLQGRIEREEWREQADDLARDGPAAARRMFESEEA